MNKLKVLFVSAELTPIIKVGGLADVAESLPKFLSKYIDIEIAIPRYKAIKEEVPFIQNTNVRIHYIDIPSYFSQRDNIYGYSDDPIRFAAFSKKVVDGLQNKQFGDIDIVHVNDYHTSFIPLLLKDNKVENIKSILTIHNLGRAYQGRYSKDILDTLQLKNMCDCILKDLKDGDINPLKQGILHADLITTVSPTYAKEILTKDYGAELEEYLNKRKNSLYGILNGIDYSIFNPETDNKLYANYGIKNFKEGKFKNKRLLLDEIRLNFNPDFPLYSFVARLDYQKGIDILIDAIQKLENKNVNFLILGTGAKDFEEKLKELEIEDRNMFAEIIFDTVMANRIYAASDVLIIPSKYEPSGLTQMIAMKYGTLPLVRSTGGLKDSVDDMVDGFCFDQYTSESLTDAINKSLSIFKKDKWFEMINNAMNKDFSWDKSALEYLDLYKKIKNI